MLEYKKLISDTVQELEEKTLFIVYAAGNTRIKRGNIELECLNGRYYPLEVSMRSIESSGPKNLWVIMNVNRKNDV